MKIYTCATRPFIANAQFFARDSGLLCRALQEIGVESKVILPAMEGRDLEDTDEIIRVSDADFRDSSWWKKLGVDGVIFIAWGFKEDTAAIKAATDSGSITCALFDHAGNNFPIHDLFTSLRIFWIKGNAAESFPKKLFGTAARAVYFGLKGIPEAFHRSEQFAAPHIAAFNSPTGLSRNHRLRKLFHPESKADMVLTGWPVPDSFSPLPREQRNHKIIAIGRWNDIRHKRPFVLMRVVERLLPLHPDLEFEIYGNISDALASWHDQLPHTVKSRAHLNGIRPSEEIAVAIGRSKILYCPSAADGIPLCVIEGLGGGCSIVGLRSIDVAGMHWAISEGDGTFAETDRIQDHVAALTCELNAWAEGKRDPLDISTRWRKWFAAKSCARRFTELIQQRAHPS